MGPAEPEVSTSAGRVRGRVEHGNAVFRGIPFAKPPLGDLRFQAPVSPDRWDGVRDAAAFGPQAPQAAFPGTPGAVPLPEDTTGEWLTVNVWTPDPGARSLPVMVWIHGGAYLFGSGGAGYDGTTFANAGVVFVSCNYRLGMEGFAQIAGAPANRGLLDAVAALRWVQQNIAQFGGDPANVTVFGESAGAGVIAALLAMTAAKGLFHRAIAQSVPGTFFAPALAAAVTAAVAASAGLPGTYEALRETDPMRLVAAQMDVTARMKEFQEWGAVRITDTPFSPVIDGEVLPRAPWRALVSGAARDVALLTGHNKDEYRLFIAAQGRLGQITEEEADTVLGYFAPGPTARPATGRPTPAGTRAACSRSCSPTGCSACRPCTSPRPTPCPAAPRTSTNSKRKPPPGRSAPATRSTSRSSSAPTARASAPCSPAPSRPPSSPRSATSCAANGSPSPPAATPAGPLTAPGTALPASTTCSPTSARTPRKPRCACGSGTCSTRSTPPEPRRESSPARSNPMIPNGCG